jgi:hypothetical protein
MIRINLAFEPTLVKAIAKRVRKKLFRLYVGGAGWWHDRKPRW